jgi:hypothetical protein
MRPVKIAMMVVNTGLGRTGALPSPAIRGPTRASDRL